jgi:hypothetical protein
MIKNLAFDCSACKKPSIVFEYFMAVCTGRRFRTVTNKTSLKKYIKVKRQFQKTRRHPYLITKNNNTFWMGGHFLGRGALFGSGHFLGPTLPVEHQTNNPS